jgi:DNA-binding NtrC family response regulator
MLEPGHQVLVVESGAQATAAMVGKQVDALLVDLAGGPDALKFLRKQRGQPSHPPVVCIADRRRPDAASEALRLGIVDLVSRPVRADDLTAALANAREFGNVSRAAGAPEQPDPGEDTVFGASPAMRDVLGIVHRVAPSRCAVLLVGERGTGREMIARAIHEQSSRRDLPFVKVVCGDVASPELERLLAGHIVAGTTVYLEGLGELPGEAQLRVQAFIRDRLDMGRGDGDHTAGPLRFIAGAEPSVYEEAERGTFRRGLLELVGVVRIDLPPLRQRTGDIPLLATFFLKEACRRADVPSKTFSRSALTLLAALPWFGNAAELRSLTERLAVLIPRGVILLEDVLESVRFEHAEALGRPRESLRVARERFERDYVASVLKQHRGRMGAAARQLGIERTNLYRKIKQLNIHWTIPE